MNDTQHRYYTDLYVRSSNKCIEVKSDYTVTVNPHITELKKLATIDAGYNYELRVYNRKGERVFIETVCC